MTESQTAPATDAEPPASRSGWMKTLSKLWPLTQLLVSLALVSAALVWLIQHPQEKKNAVTTSKAAPAVEPLAPMLVSVDKESSLGKKLVTHKVEAATVTDPILRVTGVVIASRRPGADGQADFWQFNSVELLTIYSAWQKAMADELFATSQVEQIKELADGKEAALKKTIERLQKLVRVGTETERDLVTQQNELKQTIIQDRKDIYQAETAVKTAHREMITQTLQLRQSGLDPEILKTAPPDLDIISAEVPEALLDRVALGQSCAARFVGIPSEEFLGKITTISPVLSSEQRTLRVMVDLRDPVDRLRPGMFASIGLGTDPRSVLRIPASGVVHLGRKDYVLVSNLAAGATDDKLQFRAVEVQVSELLQGRVEVQKGVADGDVIVGDHAILLKPVLLASQRLPVAKTADARGPNAPERTAGER